MRGRITPSKQIRNANEPIGYVARIESSDGQKERFHVSRLPRANFPNHRSSSIPFKCHKVLNLVLRHLSQGYYGIPHESDAEQCSKLVRRTYVTLHHRVIVWIHLPEGCIERFACDSVFRHRAGKLPDQPRTFSDRRTRFAFKAGSAFWCNSV
jgi:hypothetical protein